MMSPVVPKSLMTEKLREYEVQKREDGSLFELRRGSMGVTYKAFDTNLRRFAALTIISPEAIATLDAEARFIRESCAAAKLRHPHIPAVYHLGKTPDNAHILATEFCEGLTIERLLKNEGALAWKRALEIAAQAADALAAAAEQNLTHREINPSNLVLVRAHEQEALKVIGFCLARAEEDSAAGSSKDPEEFIDAPYFASPEQIQRGTLDSRSDIYSLGSTLWFMLAGSPPFTGSSWEVIGKHLTAEPDFSHLANVPEEVIALIRRMLEKKVLDRPQTAREVQERMRECLLLEPEVAPADGSPLAQGDSGAPDEMPAQAARPAEEEWPAHDGWTARDAESATDTMPTPDAEPARDAEPMPVLDSAHDDWPEQEGFSAQEGFSVPGEWPEQDGWPMEDEWPDLNEGPAPDELPVQYAWLAQDRWFAQDEWPRQDAAPVAVAKSAREAGPAETLEEGAKEPHSERELLELIEKYLLESPDGEPGPDAIQPALAASMQDAAPASAPWTPSLRDVLRTRRRLEPVEAFRLGDILAAILDKEGRSGVWHGALVVDGISIHFRDPLSESAARAKLRDPVNEWPPFDLAIRVSDNPVEAKPVVSSGRETASTAGGVPGDWVQQLARLLYELLDGIPGAQRGPVTNLGPSGNAVLRRGIVKGLTDYPRAADLIEALHAVTADNPAPVSAPRRKTASSPRDSRISRGKKWLVAIGIVIGVAAAFLSFVVSGWIKLPSLGGAPIDAADSRVASIPKPIAVPVPVEQGGPPIVEPSNGEKEPDPGADPFADGSTGTIAGIPRISTQAPGVPAKKEDATAADHFNELVAQGQTSRESGALETALIRFREAATTNPQSPIPIAEIAATYEKMGLGERASEQWRHIHDMGEAAGIYFSLADARLKMTAANKAPADESKPEIEGIAPGMTLGLLRITTEDKRDEGRGQATPASNPDQSAPRFADQSA